MLLNSVDGSAVRQTNVYTTIDNVTSWKVVCRNFVIVERCTDDIFVHTHQNLIHATQKTAE